MNGRMKVMIGYDGSSYADAAIEDLRCAGLPRDSEVLVVSTTDLSAVNQPISEFDMHSLVSQRADAVLRSVKGFRGQAIREAEISASKAVERLRRQFPEWKVGYEILQGKPSAALLRKAAAWKPDLIVVGSHGRSAIGRFFLGSVSKKIAEDALCAVRVARRGCEKTAAVAPNKIIAGAGSLADAERIVEAIGSRVWAGETKVRLVKIDDGASPGRVSAVYPYAKELFEQSAGRLAAIGLQVSVEIKSGNLKSALLEAAENWKADAIFVAASGAYELANLSQTAASLVTDAACTVEIVR